MKPYYVFTTPEDANVVMNHDDGVTFSSTPGEADGRPAHVLKIEGVSDGHGAELVVTAKGYNEVRHRGILWTNRGDRAEFAVDDIHLTKSFR